MNEGVEKALGILIVIILIVVAFKCIGDRMTEDDGPAHPWEVCQQAYTCTTFPDRCEGLGRDRMEELQRIYDECGY